MGQTESCGVRGEAWQCAEVRGLLTGVDLIQQSVRGVVVMCTSWSSGAVGPSFLDVALTVARCDLTWDSPGILKSIRLLSRPGKTDKDQRCGMARESNEDCPENFAFWMNASRQVMGC